MAGQSATDILLELTQLAATGQLPEGALFVRIDSRFGAIAFDQELCVWSMAR